MANTLYENFVLENKLTDLLNTRLGVRALMTVDNSLTESAGMTKRIHTYTYTGTVEELEKGAGNSTRGAVSFVSKDYKVNVYQQAFDYFDEEIMTDPKVLDMGMEGASTLMVNDMNTKYFAELAKATTVSKYSTALSYDAVVDAIQLLNIESEEGLFLIINPALKAQVRKDADFKSARQGEILFNGQIGDICGVPVLVSKLVPVDTAYLASKDAVTFYTKKESEVEQERDANTRKNSLYMRKVGLVALTDNTKVVKLEKTV